MLIAPSQCASVIAGLGADAGGEVAKYRAELANAEVTLWCVPSVPFGGHYTYLKVTKNATEIEYKDALPEASSACKKGAQAVLRSLGILDKELPDRSNKDLQADMWSCGLHVVKWMETELRSRRGEPKIPPTSITDITKRTNLFIHKIKVSMNEAGYTDKYKLEAKAKADAARAAKKAEADAKAANKAKEPEFATLDEALSAGLECTSCYVTKWGTKGCRRCMGKWFEEIRVSDGHGNDVIDIKGLEALGPAPMKKPKK